MKYILTILLIAISSGCSTVETTTKNADGSVTTVKSSSFDTAGFSTAVGASAGAISQVRSTQGFAK
jgi:uncharacterized protein YceK